MAENIFYIENITGCNEVTDEGIKELGRLHTLDLRNCNKITDEGIKRLGNVTKLYRPK